MEETPETDKGQSLKNAFFEVLQIRGISKRLGLHKSRVAHYKADAGYGIFPSYETMRSILEKAGYIIIQEERWEKPE